MNRVLEVVNKISSQRSPTRFLLSAADKAAIDGCNRQMTLACGVFRVRKPSKSSQSVHARFLLDSNWVHHATSHFSD